MVDTQSHEKFNFDMWSELSQSNPDAFEELRQKTLDEFIEAMKAIKEEANNDPDKLLKAPLNAPIGRLDLVIAARKPKLRW